MPSSSGPFGIPADAEPILSAALDKAAEELARARTIGTSALRGDLVGFVTWCFWRCPENVADYLLTLYEGGRAPPVNANLLRQGLGRVVHRLNEIDRFLAAIDARMREDGDLTAPELAALGNVLARCPEAAPRLTARAADRAAQQVAEELRSENGQPDTHAYRNRFRFALKMLVALLRHRRTRPSFLDPGNRAAREILALLQQSAERMGSFRATHERAGGRTHGAAGTRHLSAARRLAKNIAIVDEIVGFLHRRGTDPNIIVVIDQSDDEDDPDDHEA